MEIKGLERFAKKVNKYSKTKNIGDTVAQKIAQRGKEIATNNYNESKRVIVRVEDGDAPNKKRIIAQGKGIAFDEFGTGLVGKGTYEGNLPKETISFESPKGSPQTTQGWEYYYPNAKTKVNGGWYAGKVFHRGQRAKAQMFNTSKQLRLELKSTANQVIKEIITNE